MPVEYAYRCERCGTDLTSEDRVVKTVRVLWKDTATGEPFREELPGAWFHESCWDSRESPELEEAARGTLADLWSDRTPAG
jgi:hypothetical protein